MRVIFILCFCSTTPAISRISMSIGLQLRFTSLTVPGYFHLPDSVVSALRSGDTSQRLAYRILSELHRNKIRAAEVLNFDTTLTKETLSDANAMKMRSAIKKIYESYRTGIKRGLRPPLPESVVYTFAHINQAMEKKIREDEFRNAFKVEVFKADNEWRVRYPSNKGILEILGAEMLHNIGNLLHYVVARQLRFFENSARGDYLQPLNIFDKAGRLKSLQRLHVHEASKDLHLSPEKIYSFIDSRLIQIHTEWGIFPLHFFFRDVAAPDEGLLMKIKEKIDNENPLSPLTDRDLADSLAETEEINITARKAHDYRHKLGIASFADRRKKVVSNIVKDMIKTEDAFAPLSDIDIADHLRTMGLYWSAKEVLLLRQELAIPSSRQRKNYAVRDTIAVLIESEGLSPLSNREIVQILTEMMSYTVNERTIRRHLRAVAVPSYRERRNNLVEKLLRQIIAAEDPTQPLSAGEIAERLQEHEIFFSKDYIYIYLRRLGIAPTGQRKE